MDAEDYRSLFRAVASIARPWPLLPWEVNPWLAATIGSGFVTPKRPRLAPAVCVRPAVVRVHPPAPIGEAVSGFVARQPWVAALTEKRQRAVMLWLDIIEVDLGHSAAGRQLAKDVEDGLINQGCTCSERDSNRSKEG
eukprot:5008467-Amphidinium_carterae.1